MALSQNKIQIQNTKEEKQIQNFFGLMAGKN
jgi:hypothetical protein